MRYKSFPLLILAIFSAVYAAEPALTLSTLSFPQSGFSIAPYDAPPGDVTTIALTMTQPAADKFSPNVNVMILPYAKSMKEFITLSKTQFTQVGFTSISEKTPNDNEWVVEYKGSMQGQQLHFYAMAVSANNHVYLVTGTTTELKWTANAEKIKKCVDSFKINDASTQSVK